MSILAAASESEAPPTSMIVLVLVLITGGTIYTFGYLRAVRHRAHADYIKTKEGLPGMRKDSWRALWNMLKVGFWVFVGIAILIVWVGRDLRDTGEGPQPVPAKISPSVAPK